MRKKLFASTLYMACSIFMVLGLIPAHAYDPRVEWKTLTTAHFRIHYPVAQQSLAQTTAVLAERVHDELAPRLQWTPVEKTEMVLADDSDLANGYASMLPFNQIHLRVSAPEPGDFMEVSDEQEWLYQLIRHEYVHVLHLDANSRFPRVLQKIFGRQWFTFPAAFQPAWVVEGLATDIETDSSRGTGRGAGSDMSMLMRTEVLNGVKPLHQVSLQMMDAWPRGYGAYIYGLHFFQFLRDRYGEDAALRMIKSFRGNFIPYRIHNNARLTTGKSSMDVVWAEFENWLKKRYQPQIDSIRAAGLQEGQLLTSGGRLDKHSSLQVTADEAVWYVRSALQDPAALIRRSTDGREAVVAGVNGMARFDVHATAGVVLAQPELCDSERLYFDLYLLAPGHASPRRLTHCARYRNVVWRPDGQGFYATREDNGQSRIDQLALNGSLEQTLWTAPQRQRVSQLAISPDGHSLVFVHSQAGQGSNLLMMDIDSRSLRSLTLDRNSEVMPRFTADGTSLLFSSDHGGVSNVRRLDLATGAITTLSNTLTGAFAPSQGSRNGPIWFMRQTGDGADLARIDTTLAAPLPAATPADPHPVNVVTTPTLPSAPYSPWSTLMPRAWFPLIEADNARTVVGVMSHGSDVLGVHRYSASLARDVRNDSWVGGFSYSLWDRLLLGVARTQDVNLADDKTVRVRNIDRAALGLQFPWLRYAMRARLTAGLVWERESDLWHAASLPDEADHQDGVAGLALDLDTTLPVAKSAGPTAGRRLHLSWETSDALGRSDYSGQTAAFDWREYMNLGHGRVLAARLGMARGSSGIQPYALGGSFNELSAGLGLPFNQRDKDLRSYDDGTLQGHGYQRLAMELRTPLWSVDRTWTTPPLGLTHVHGSLYAESARVLNEDWSDWYSGVGGELTSEVVVGYRLPLDLRAGLAWGLQRDNDAGGARAYLSLGYAF